MKKLIYTLVILAIAISLNAQWVQTSNGLGIFKYVSSMTSVGNYIFVAASDTNDNGNSRVFVSTNNGANWTETGLYLIGKDVNCLTVLGTDVYAGADSVLYRSTNYGATWSFSLINKIDVLGVAAIDSYVFAGGYHWTGTSGVYRTSGSGWTYTDLHIPVYSFAKLGTNIFAGTDHYGVYISSNNGLNWTPKGMTNKHVHSLAVLGSNIFAGTDTGIYVSTNNGINWGLTAITSGYSYSITSSGSILIAGLYPGGVYNSSNNGASWTAKNQGFTGLPIITPLLIVGNYVFAGTYGQSVWRRPLSEVIGIQNISTEIPSAYSLSQNYPNPFNPTTNIRFDISKSGSVKLVVFDALGREVATLVNEKLAPGTYEVDWNGSGYASGVYFYRIQTDEFSDTKKMLMIK